MSLIVQKYGGSSVAGLDKIRNIAARVKDTYDKGHKVVVVVSAQSGVTNLLIEKARELNARPNKREMDMLLSVGEQETIALTALAIDSLGVPAISKTGAQAGIVTDEHHTKARIKSIDCGNIPELLRQNYVVIVAGFQGINHSGCTTTLGRGGSDLTAIALAHALRADKCEIYTDVDGVYTADPRMIPDARKIDEINYEEMLELSSMGTRVMQARAVEFAQKYNVSFEVRSSLVNKPGTVVKSKNNFIENPLISSIALDEDQAKVDITDLRDQMNCAKILEAMAMNDITIDMIGQSIDSNNFISLSFTVRNDDMNLALECSGLVVSKLGFGEVKVYGGLTKLSIVGIGLCLHSGIANVFLSTLLKAKILVKLITTSEMKMSAIVNREQAALGAQVLHEVFELGKELQNRIVN